MIDACAKDPMKETKAFIAKTKDPKYCPAKCPECPKGPCKGKCTWYCWVVSLLCAYLTFILLQAVLPYIPPWGADYEKSSSAKPLVIYCERSVADIDAYKSAFGSFATSTQSAGAGVWAMFSYMSVDTEGKALQFSMFKDADAFLAQPFTSAAVDATYDPSGTAATDFCQVYGNGWTDAVVSATASMGPKFYFAEGGSGFIRSAGEEGYSYEHADTPMIMISKRQFRPGMGPGTVPLFQHVTDMIYPVAAGCIAAYDFPAQEKADYAWSLRIFSSYTKGFLPHIYGNILTAPTLAATLIPRWASPIFPVGNSFSTAGDIGGAIAGFPGNAVYKQYTFDGDDAALGSAGLIGPAPALSKGAP